MTVTSRSPELNIELFRHRALDTPLLMPGNAQLDGGRVEAEPRGLVCRGAVRAVARVADYWMARARELDANLVLAPGLEGKLDEGAAVFGAQ
jgi:hypothetical protein